MEVPAFMGCPHGPPIPLARFASYALKAVSNLYHPMESNEPAALGHSCSDFFVHFIVPRNYAWSPAMRPGSMRLLAS